MRLEEIKKRLAEIETELKSENADIEALNKEVDELIEERKQIEESIQKRNDLLTKVAEKGAVIENFEKREVKEMKEFTIETVLDTKEYRNAWAKTMLGQELSEIEKRAFDTANVKTIPTELQNEIISRIKQRNPLFNHVTMLNVKGFLQFAIEGTTADAQLHTQNKTINADADTMIQVTLGAYEITKLCQISASASEMSISAFENWLISNIADRVSDKACDLMLNGTGTSQPKGLDKVTWDAENSISVAKASSLTAQNVLDLFGLLPSEFDANAIIVMSKKTLFNDFMPLQDKSKNDIVKFENGNYYVQGTLVVLCSKVALHEAYLGDFSKIACNMAVDEEVKKGYDIDTNSYKFLGVATFDSTCALESAFVKLVKGE